MKAVDFLLKTTVLAFFFLRWSQYVAQTGLELELAHVDQTGLKPKMLLPQSPTC
jgi:hypothetical protein